MANENYIVILAGGGGTRLWPKSRKSAPKQFLKLINNKTLFQETIDRVKGFVSAAHIFVVTSKEFRDEVKKQASEIPVENILIESESKNTTAAAGLAAAVIYKKNPAAIMSTLAADHYIAEKEKFLKILSVSQRAAAKGDYIVTIGIHPTHAHTGLGYIHVNGESFRINKTPVFKVAEFKEKPDQATAHAYYASGEHFWNANINSYKVSTLLLQVKKYSPTLYKVLEKILAGKNQREIESLWRQLPAEPIDTAILEKTKNVLMVAGDFSWFDIGDWSTLHSILSTRAAWNVLLGENEPQHLGIETEGCLIHGTGRLIATLGLKDLVIIDTPDVLLICPKSRSQEVRKLVEKLVAEKKHSYL